MTDKDRREITRMRGAGMDYVPEIEVNQSAKKTKATLSVWWLPKADRPQKRLLRRPPQDDGTALRAFRPWLRQPQAVR